MRQRVLVASNRGPVSYEVGADGTLVGRRGGGGLIAGMPSGLASVAAQAEAIWICAALSDGDRLLARGPQAVTGNPEDPGEVRIRMLDIPPETLHRAYNKVANAVLWFTHHLLFDTPNQPQFGHEFRLDWEEYRAYNQAFADALAQEIGAAPAAPTRVLVQDYHLTLAPRLLRDQLGDQLDGGPGDVGIAHFSHTPWAPPDYYRVLPRQVGRAVLDGILGADHAGFHARRWADAFLDCCEVILGAQVSRAGAGNTAGRVSYRGRVTEVAVHPLGVDVPALRASAQADDVRAHVGELGRAVDGKLLIVRIDRVEPSKNIVRGLAAYRELLATRPEWHGRVVHLAFAYPSRTAVPQYQAYPDQITRIARQISEEFRTPEWDPLILQVRDDYPRSLAACALADVLLVNPIRDGMNLVAQEGPVVSERGCALVLSSEAGVAAKLGDHALLVNPYDVSETAEALHQALVMPEAERRRRSAALAATAAVCPPARWLQDQLAALAG
ncbi:MAG TPA: trehalose-6-phosphate synthase [Streptosporangiaceae bacterium]